MRSRSVSPANRATNVRPLERFHEAVLMVLPYGEGEVVSMALARRVRQEAGAR